MFEVLVFVYENYWRGEACPELPQLGRKLSAHGFEADEIEAALAWLDGLNMAARGTPWAEGAGDTLPPALQAPAHDSLRIYSAAEQDRLGAEGLGFLHFLDSAGVLTAVLREIVIDRAMATPGTRVDLDDLKIIILMVYWSLGVEPDALVLDELCADTEGRVAH